jgi:isoaspartyl peptidase/L-asparaginase-like protein (Ntn-hydrolase superfamily)
MNESITTPLSTAMPDNAMKPTPAGERRQRHHRTQQQAIGHCTESPEAVLFVLTPGAGTVQAFAVDASGALVAAGAAPGVPASAQGLVAY